MAALAHNVLNPVRKLSGGVGPPGLLALADAMAANAGNAPEDGAADLAALSPYLFWNCRWAIHLRHALR